MSSCSKTSGGFQRNQVSSEASAITQEDESQPTKITPLTTEYRSRLRPRPTKKPEHYETQIFPRRLSSEHIARRSISEPNVGISVHKIPAKRSSDIKLSLQVKPKVLKEVPKVGLQESVPGTSGLKYSRKVVGKCAKKETVSETQLGKRSNKSDFSRSFPFGSKKKKKLASNSELDRNTASEELKTKVKPSTSSDVPSSSTATTGSKSGTKPKTSNAKVTNRFPLNRKTKSAESKSRLFSIHSSRSGKLKSGKGETASSESKGKKSTSKTGSCASSRRGLERGKRSSTAAESSDRTVPPDEGCAAASNNATMHNSRSRHNRESRNQASASTENNETGNAANRASGPASGTLGTASGLNLGASSNNDSESEDSDITRLQALLEARGLPPHFFGNLGPRMQQILHRSMGSGVSSKSQQYLQGMQAVGDESRQLQAAIGMCQLLVMGNEDTLAGFPIKSAVPALISLLKMEHNFDLMNHACRALTYMMEALPRSSAVVVDAIPVFLEKLQVIQCMDVAEQSLTALDMLSRRHAPAILAAGGQSSCLLYIDFFSLPAQRSALSVAANCCLAIGTLSSNGSSNEEEFNRLVKSSLPLLSSRLTHHDKKCVESACMCFVRLVENYQQEAKILSEIAENDLFKNFQQLLVVTPPLLSSSTFIMVIRTMTIMCSCVWSLAKKLVKDNIAETLKYLLCGTAPESETGQVELMSRSPQELFEITSLIGELLPRLPKGDPLFSINYLLWQGDNSDMNGKSSQMDRITWQWKDESGQWRPYIRHDSRIIEMAHTSGEQEVNLTTMDRSYTLDFETLQQINDDTGTTRAVQRVVAKGNSSDLNRKSGKKHEVQATLPEDDTAKFEDSPELSNFMKLLFVILYEVYSSSAGSPAVRHKCLLAIQRMVYYTKSQLLSDILRDLTVSSHISSMLSSPDIKVVVGALQLAEMLMQKLPDIFAEMFRREGVLHQVKKLTEPYHPLVGTEKVSKATPQSSASSSRRSTPGYEVESPTVKSHSPPSADGSSSYSPSSVGRRVSPPLTKAKAFAAAMTTKDNDTPTGAKKKVSTRSSRATRSSTSSFFSNLNPTKWGRSLSSALSNDSSTSNTTDMSETSSAQSQRSESKNTSLKSKRNSLGLPNLTKFSPSTKDTTDLDQVKEWIRKQAAKFLEEYFTRNPENNKQTNILEQLTTIAKGLSRSSCDAQESLKLLSAIVSSVDVSSFELQHSGLVTSLLQFLTSPDSVEGGENRPEDQNLELKTRPSVISKVPGNIQSFDTSFVSSSGKYEDTVHSRIRCFLHVFAGLPDSSLVPVNEAISQLSASQVAPMQNLVRKLNLCVGQVEQLPVKGHDLMSGGSQMLRVLSTRQLKCQLQRHPDSNNVKQWLGGPVKVDPLVQVQAIERYLTARGYGVKSSNSSSSESTRQLELLHDQEDDSEDEIQEDNEEELSLDDNTSDCVSSEAESHLSGVGGTASSSSAAFGDLAERRERKPSANSMHKLEFYIGNHKLPHHITVYQAVRQYSWSSGNMSSDEDSDTSLNISENAAVWSKTHVIRYKLIGGEEKNNTTSKVVSSKHKSGKKMKNSTKQGRALPKSPKPNDPTWVDGILPAPTCPLDKFLVPKLPPYFSTNDACSEVLCLLRVAHAISRYWYYMYSLNAVYTDRPLVPPSEFINLKINTKCTRQLQDPLIIITGQLTTWLQEIAVVCPFLLAFETRQLLFKITAFDRDRAMQHLLDIGAAQEFSTAMSNASNSGDGRSHSSSSRFMPRIEKKKCSVSRNNLLQQAERIIFDYGHSKAMVEVDYENEVGTGLGPTLEFFTLTSKELQKRSLNLWREELAAGQQPTNPETEASPVKEIKVETDESDKNADCKVVSCKSIEEDDLIVDEITTSSTNLKKFSHNEEMLSEADKEFVNSSTGLFPKPIGRSAKLSQVTRIRGKFRFLGKFLAKALMDGRMVDLPLSVTCYKWLLGEQHSFCGLDLEYVDPGLALTFNKLRRVAHEGEVLLDTGDDLDSVLMDGCPIDDLGLDMQLPGYPNVELMKLGRSTAVTIQNLDKYLKLITHWTMFEGTRRQFEAMKEGFESVLPLSSLNYFFPEELDQLFCGSRYQPWDVQELTEMCHPDHGYTQDSPTVKTLYRILSTYDHIQQRNFLQFVTGCPHLPVGGFRALNPRLTIVRKTCEEAENVDDYLPSVMTCLNYLKLPEYSSETIMRHKLQLAAVEGQKSFLLS